MPRTIREAISLLAVSGAIGCLTPLGTSRLVAQDIPEPSACSQVVLNKFPNGRASRIENQPGRLGVTAWRLRTWRQHELPNGKWVGVAHHLNWSEKESSFFPGLTPDKVGCLRFRATPAGVDIPASAEAALYSSDDALLHTYANSIACIHPHDHPSTVRPELLSAPKKCKEGTKVIATITGSNFLPQTRQFKVEKDGFKAAFKRAFEEEGVVRPYSSAVAQALLLLEQPGPWFPCSANGCCRAL